jgi:hypothetical protein
MMGDSHELAGPAAWFLFSATTYVVPDLVPLRMDGFEIVAGSAVASRLSHGWPSPDADGHKVLAKLIPGGHRGPLHMPDLMSAVGAGLIWAAWGSPARSMVVAAAVAWMAHLAADMGWGKVPFLLAGGRRYGLTLDTDGWTERWLVRRLLLPLAVVSGVVAMWLATVGGIPALDMPSVSEVASWRP